MKIVIPDNIEIPQNATNKILKLNAQIYNDTPDKAELIRRIKDADIITANYVDITAEVIDAAPKLKYIIVPAVGHEWVDHKHARSKGIKVLNCPTHNSQAVAELAISLMFAVARRVTEASASLRDGEWHAAKFKGVELSGKRLGLIGYGNIGKLVEKMAHGIGMTVGHANSRSTPQEIDKLLMSSDVVTLCLPLKPETIKLIDSRRLNMLKPNTILINVARGAIIDQQALKERLSSHGFAGAGLDVFTDEPLTGSPTQDIIELVNLPNVVATPHYGYNTAETAQRLGDELYSNIQSCLNNTPSNLVS